MRSYSETAAKRAVVVSAVGVSLALGCGEARLEVLEQSDVEFLEHRGKDLYLHGRPYRYLSFNAYTLTGCGTADEVPNDAQLAAFFASLRPNSLVRTYAFEALGQKAVERVVAAAKANGQRLILVLAADGGDCEAPTKKTNDWYATGFRAGYLPWVQKIVPLFKDEPAVGMWELVKGPLDVEPLTLRNFFDVVGGEIHRLDPNHLVESGTHGPWAYGGADGYELIHRSAGVDVASSHEYDNVSDAPLNLQPSRDALATLSKPLIIAEIGMFASATGDPNQQFGSQTCISWLLRRGVFARQLEAAFAQPFSGANIWNWVPVATGDCAISVPPGDPLLELVRAFPIP